MNLILWRHAEAEEGSDDLARRLTDKGRTQAAATAGWLHAYLPADVRVWASEAERSRATAEALGLPFETVPALNPVNRVEALPALLHQAAGENCLIWVGHQPWIGRLCTWLLQGSWQPDVYWSVKKSGLWWFKLSFSADGRCHAKLRAAMTPQILLGG